MPTNLKSLLSRSRSRNELKLREKGDEGTGGAATTEVTSTSESSSGSLGSPGSGQYRLTIATTTGVGSSTVANTNTTGGGGGGGRITDFGSPAATLSASRRKDAAGGCKSFFSCSALHGVGLVTGSTNGEGRSCTCGSTPGQNTLSGSSSKNEAVSNSPSNVSNSSRCSCCYLPATEAREMKDSSCGSILRKCETVLALSSLQGNSSSVSSGGNGSFSTSSSSADMRSGKSVENGAGTPAETHLSSSYSSSSPTPSSGRVKVMKDKIFSTSSSTLNSLFHSSSNRTRFFPGWKTSSSSSAATAPTAPPSTNNTSYATPVMCPPANNSDSSSVANGISVSPLSHLCHGGLMLMTGGNSGASIGHNEAISRSQLSISEAPMTPVNRLRRNLSTTSNSNNASQCFLHCNLPAGNCSEQQHYSRSSSVASFGSNSNWKEDQFCSSASSVSSSSSTYEIFCRLCLSSYKLDDTCQLSACSCRYCTDCLVAYVCFEIQEGAYDIACPDASCDKEGVLTLAEIENLVPKSLMDKHRKFRLYREVEKDRQVMWCPTPGCETVCMLQQVVDLEEAKVRPGFSKFSITCTTCAKTFCAECKLSWHPDSTCESYRRKLVKQGKLNVDDEEIYTIESIKKCPFCYVPIEKDSGCAQMMCKRCKHVFCWYCLASLDDDFLLRHYDKGPCKNKLGHSRASVVWHRAQVIGIFAGFGVLVLLASPLLILAAPCLLCCRCRYCANKLDPEDPVSL